MLVAAALLAGLTALAVPRLEAVRGRLAFEAHTQTVSRWMRDARRLAIQTSKPQLVTVDLSRKRVVDAGGVREIEFDGEVAMRLLTASSETVSRRVGRIRFFPDGSATGGQLRLERQGRTIVLDVDWLTGRVKRYDEGA